MRKQKKKRELSTQYLIRISQIFEKNNWLIESKEDAKDSLFNRFCERILEINENKKRDLVLELTERYLWVQEEQYIYYLIDAVKKMMQMKPEINEKTKIYIMPLVSPKDEGKTKSSSMLVYLFNSVKLRHDNVLSRYKFEIIDKNENLSLYLENKDAILVLADDYVGTGETAEKCLLHILKMKVEISQIAIVSLVAQQMGLDYLSKYTVCVSASVVRQRGISDFYEDEILHENIQLMREIEDKMSIREKYKFGYKKSEALVTMCRTPNNTFPIFWEESGNMKIAPFPRF
jgi:hypothetical protein